MSENPFITVVMNTDGCFPKLIEEAVYSVLKQTYKNIILLIVCRHPDGLRLDKKYDNVEIHNASFNNFSQQIVYSLKQIKTPYWTTVDSDDYIIPTHIEDMISNFLEYKRNRHLSDSFEFSTSVCFVSIDNKIIGSHSSFWWGSLCSKLDEYQLSFLQERADRQGKVNAYFGFDGIVMQTLKEHHVLKNKKVSYLYRKKVATHVSSPFLKVERKCDNLPIIVPQLYDNYEEKIKEFEDSSISKEESVNGGDIALFNDIIENENQKNIVEIGCGNYTVFLESLGGTVLAFGRDKDRTEYIQTRLKNSKVILWDTSVYKQIKKCDIVFVSDDKFEDDVLEYISNSNPNFIILKCKNRFVKKIIGSAYFDKYYLMVQTVGSKKYTIFILKDIYDNIVKNNERNRYGKSLLLFMWSHVVDIYGNENFIDEKKEKLLIKYHSEFEGLKDAEKEEILIKDIFSGVLTSEEVVFLSKEYGLLKYG